MTTDQSSPQRSVLEVAMEMALTPDVLQKVYDRFGAEAAQAAGMSTSVGGIGPLLRERVIAQGDLGLNVVGVSLLYNTVWSQGWHDWNHLLIKRVAAGCYLRDVLEDTGLLLKLPLFEGGEVDVKVWRAPFGKSFVYYLDCPEITDVVYPCAEDAPPKTAEPYVWADRQRLRHSWLAGRGALALAKALAFKPDVIVLSETPTVFAHPKLVMDQFTNDPLFESSKTVFNDHTPLEYAHPIWPKETLELTKMNPALYGPYLNNNKIDVTQVLIAVCNGVFGVAKKHAAVMRAMPSLRAYADKIDFITNGVSRDFWQHPVFRQTETLSDRELLEAKDRLKNVFVEWLWRRALLWPHWAKDIKTKPILLWTRRITSYKRLDVLERIFAEPVWRKRFLATDAVLVVGGRIYQRDNVSEKMVYELVENINRDQEVGERVVFLHNYNIWEAPQLFYGADGSIMLSDDGREASATGFMKAQMNGAGVVANPDGAVPEFVFFSNGDTPDQPPNGFRVDYSNGQPDLESFLTALQNFSNAYKSPAHRVAMIRNAVAVTAHLDVTRTAREMSAFFDRLS